MKPREKKHYRAKVFRSGNSLALRLPAGLTLSAGMEMDLTVEDDALSKDIFDRTVWCNPPYNELAHGSWSLVIANLSLTGIDGPEFTVLSDLASAPPVQDGISRVRVLFVVPELLAGQALPILEHAHLPYVMKPFHFHDFLQKVGDLLIESKALPKSIRTAKFGFEDSDRRKKSDRRAGKDRRGTTMFAPREDYYMTEEELAEWETNEKEEQKKRKLTDRPI